MRLLASFRSAAVAVIASSSFVSASTPEIKEPEIFISVVYNHEASAGARGLEEAGGFSAYVRLGERSVLLDVGGEAGVIMQNLQHAGVDVTGLDAVVISHNHWDHVYGLPGVMGGTGARPPVLVPASAASGLRQQFPRATVVPVQEAVQIVPRIWVTEPLEAEVLGVRIAEQALVLEHPAGIHVITGCSHPGIEAIVEQVKLMFPDAPIGLVAGGFHLRSTDEQTIRRIAADLRRLGVQKIAPSHCTGDAAKRIFRQQWGEGFVSFDLGDTYRF